MLLIATLVCALTACSSTLVVRRPLDPANDLAWVKGQISGSHAEAAVSASGATQRLDVADVAVGTETTEWTEEQAGTKRRASVPTAALQRIVVRERSRGALEGAGIGMSIGGLGGLVGGAIACSQPGLAGPYCGFGVAIAVLASMGVGLVAGTVTGAAIGHRHIVEFADWPAIPLGDGPQPLCSDRAPIEQRAPSHPGRVDPVAAGATAVGSIALSLLLRGPILLPAPDPVAEFREWREVLLTTRWCARDPRWQLRACPDGSLDVMGGDSREVHRWKLEGRRLFVDDGRDFAEVELFDLQHSEGDPNAEVVDWGKPLLRLRGRDYRPCP